jgi:hypothetical protein
MGVNQIGSIGAPPRAQCSAESRHIREQRVFGERRAGSRGKVFNGHTGSKMDLLWKVAMVSPRVHSDFDTAAPQLGRESRDVDVLPSRIRSAQRSARTCMLGNQSDVPDW